jgi:hypothetical protein
MSCRWLEGKTKSLSEAYRAEDACRIINETSFVQHANGLCLEIALPPKGIVQLPERGRIQLDRHRIDRKVPTIEILLQGSRCYIRQGSWLYVRLPAGRGNIYLETVGQNEPGRRKPFKHGQPCPVSVGYQPRESDAVTFHREIKIPIFSPQQQIPYHAADEIQGHTLLIRKGSKLTKKRQKLSREATQKIATRHQTFHGASL